eukprot:5288881-Amphidinium_carterae.1
MKSVTLRGSDHCFLRRGKPRLSANAGNTLARAIRCLRLHLEGYDRALSPNLELKGITAHVCATGANTRV